MTVEAAVPSRAAGVSGQVCDALSGWKRRPTYRYLRRHAPSRVGCSRISAVCGTSSCPQTRPDDVGQADPPPWPGGRRPTILVSAFLLFQVQPVISKKILPWFGGSPAVWTTCVLFFQLVLLGGYAYAHWLIQHVPTRRQGIIHAVAAGAGAVHAADRAQRTGGSRPTATMPALRILLLLLLVVGVPYFLLSTTGPLVQAWFARLYPGRSPYRLYALSNVGSLAALLTYPFLVRDDAAGRYTRAISGRWALSCSPGLIGIMALTMWREVELDATPVEVEAVDSRSRQSPRSSRASRREAAAEPPPADAPPAAGCARLAGAGGARRRWRSLAITNHLCQDIAVVPFMWVIPLSLYLLSFIICFDNERWYLRKLFGAADAAGDPAG